MCYLQLENISKIYVSGNEPVAAVSGVSLSVEQGEFIAVTGPSGCGKSTLLHMIGGLSRPSGGSVYVEGASLYRQKAADLALYRRRKVGIVYQFYNLVLELTAGENLILPALMDRRRIKKAWVDRILEILGMEDKRDCYPDQLSGGQQQKIALGRALVTRPPLLLVSLAAVHWAGTQCRIPAWMTAVILAGIFLFSCACNLRPLLSILRQPEIRCIQGRVHRGKQRSFDCFGQGRKGRFFGRQNRRNGGRTVRSFSRFLSARYRQAGRGRYFRTTVTILVAILLYVPAGYLIDTNIAVQRSGLYEKYGIQYSCHPGNQDRLEDALEEYRRLAAYCKRDDSMGYAVLDTTACVHTDEISGELRRELKKAGWRESPLLYVDSAVFFLEDEVYAAYTEERSVLVNRYTNRSSWLEEADLFFAGTPLLKEGADLGGVEVYASFTDDGEADPAGGIFPRALMDEIPEGLDDTGSLALIMPLSRLEEFCSAGIDYDRLQVQGRFADSDEEQFNRLERCLGENPVGRLVYTRQVLREWYSSMEGIHRAMNAVCATLFSIAVLNVFGMMIFQYMERKRGLAILWSLGQSPGGLFRLLLLERMHHFLTAMLAGIPLSLILCYSIYGIFRRVWQIPFALPLRQIALIGAAVLIVMGLTAAVNGYLMKHQDFLANIKEIT